MPRKRVLWADDEIEFLRAHIMFLETRGYTVVPALNGDDALDLLNREKFDIALLDEFMPGKTGLMVLEEIKRKNPNLPVVMVTKSEEEQLMDEALGRQIDGYLTKPVNPSQILSICKTLLAPRQAHDAQITQNYIRQYSENKMSISGPTTWPGWTKIQYRLAMWDIRLDNHHDEGLRQTHSQQCSECNHLFCQFIMENYVQWFETAKNTKRPVISPEVLSMYVEPSLKAGENVVLLVLSNLRLDQWLVLESDLNEYFQVERNLYCGLLPTTPAFARNSLLSGMFPDEFTKKFPDIWEKGTVDAETTLKHESDLVRLFFDSCDKQSQQLSYHSISNDNDLRTLLGKVNELAGIGLVVMVLDMLQMIAEMQSQTVNFLEKKLDGTSLRNLTRKWFMSSILFQLLKTLSRRKCKVMITSDHGSVLCTRPSQIYHETEVMKNARYRYGNLVTGDERVVLFSGVPNRYRLPRLMPNDRYIIGTENFYFVSPGKYDSSAQQNINSLQYGGISLEEMILPFSILSPK